MHERALLEDPGGAQGRRDAGGGQHPEGGLYGISLARRLRGQLSNVLSLRAPSHSITEDSKKVMFLWVISTNTYHSRNEKGDFLKVFINALKNSKSIIHININS